MKKVYRSRLIWALFITFLAGIIARENIGLKLLSLVCGPVAVLLWIHYDETKYQKQMGGE